MIISDQVPADTADINMTILPKGIAVCAFEDDNLDVIGSRQINSGKIGK